MVRSTNHFGRIAQELRPKARQLVDVATANILTRVQQSMEGKMPPSAPGTPPAIRTGYLRGSYARVPAKDNASAVEGAVYSSAEYAPHLELGTIFMAARPHLAPAVDEEAPEFRAAIGTLFR